jgi:hypothetical protein
LPPIQRPPKSHRTQVINRSRSLYADDRETVEKVVDELHMPVVDPNAQNKKNKNNKSSGKGDNNKKKDNRDNRQKAVSNGPQTTEELKAVLAQVAKDNGGKEATADSEQENQEETADTTKKLPTNASEQTQEAQKKDTYQLERFPDVERAQAEEKRQAEEAKKAQTERQVSEQKQTKDTTKEVRDERKDSEREANRNPKREASETTPTTPATPEKKDSPEETGAEVVLETREETNTRTVSELKLERFPDVERAERERQNDNRPNKKQIRHQNQQPQKKVDHKQALKLALAEVLQEADRKKAYQVPTFTPADTNQTSTPIVRVIKPEPPATPATPPVPETPPKPKPKAENPLDPKVIKKMLQSSKPEKPPMNS